MGCGRFLYATVILLSATLGAGFATDQVGAQSANLSPGGIALLVTDPAGAGMPNARVEVTMESGELWADGTTNQDGQSIIRGLSPGVYLVETRVTPCFLTQTKRVKVPVQSVANVTVKLDYDVKNRGCNLDDFSSGVPVFVAVANPEGAEIERIPSISTPRPQNLFRRFFVGLYHRFGFEGWGTTISEAAPENRVIS